VSNRRGRAGHAQKRGTVGATRTRPLQTGTRDPRSRALERSRPRLTAPDVRARRIESHGAQELKGSGAKGVARTGSTAKEATARVLAGKSSGVGLKDVTSQKAVTRMERRHAIRRRRARIVWAACGALCLLVLATSFPAQALLRQRSAISSSAAELDRLTAGNKELQLQATELSNPANIASLARSDYDMVSPGEKAYEVLPSTGASQASSQGQSSLDQGPVAPGSAASQALLGDAGSAISTASGLGAASSPGSPVSGSPGTLHGATGLWGRVLDTLEFWR
jgi:cell division protein FtsB